MDVYTRSSRAVRLAEARPALREALRELAERHGLALDELEALETRSVRAPGFTERLLGRDTTSWSLAVVAPGLLVWAVQGERETKAAALAARLAELTVDRGLGRIGAAVGAHAHGLTLTARWVGASEAGSSFLGLGPEPDAAAFEQRLREAMREAGNPLHGLGQVVTS